MWVESIVQVGDEPIGLSVQRLDDDDRERTAASLAWMALEIVACGGENTPAWQEFMNDTLRDHVAFVVPEERLADLGPAWWHEAVGRALTQFVRQNELAPSINRHIETLQRLGECGRYES